ncbi:MAG: DsbA family protein [Proteobacteria bacterium]|nr:DsbA family protein [Pseudomonadota bacterium]
MPRFILSLAFIATLTASQLFSVTAMAGIVSIEESKVEMVLGKADAPVTMIEYSSLGCPHCAAFHRETLPKIQKEYIDTGKVRFVYRDFPLGTPALAASMIARCAGPKKFFGFVEILFRAQAQWSQSKDPMAALTKIARFGGLSGDDVDACLKQQTLLDHIRKGALVGQETHKVDSTPFFIIGDETVSGAQPFEAFKKVLDKALNK